MESDASADIVCALPSPIVIVGVNEPSTIKVNESRYSLLGLMLLVVGALPQIDLTVESEFCVHP